MSDKAKPEPRDLKLAAREAQTAELNLTAGPIQLRLNARVTPLGLLAFGVMMSGIVASSSAVVWAARRRRSALK